MPAIENFLIQNFGTEIIYSFVIIMTSLMIYFSTKEIYELSNYKGVDYFRKSFLFFAIAYFFRIFIKFLLVYFNARAIVDLNPSIFPMLGVLSTFLFIYFSTIAVFYLLYSLMFKKWDEQYNNKPNKKENKKVKVNRIYLFHFISFIIALFSISFRGALFYVLLNFIVFLTIIFFFIKTSRDNNLKNKSLHTLYVLLFIFWTFNVVEIFIPEFLQKTILIIYLSSLAIFLTILYKVLRRCGAN
jgi:hypothetical protein